MKSKTTAIVLCLFLGYLGAHRFHRCFASVMSSVAELPCSTNSIAIDALVVIAAHDFQSSALAACGAMVSI